MLNNSTNSKNLRVIKTARNIKDINDGAKKAWSYFTQQSTQRDSEKELLIEPMPWPITAALRWHSMRG